MDYHIDYYQVLRIKKTASREELKASYRQLAKLHHPDKNPDDPGATERFRLVQEAYEILSNEISRHIYDEYRAANETATKQPAMAPDADQTSSAQSSASNSRVFTQTTKVWREKRIYVMGRINVKFQGEPAIVETYMTGREQDYTIYPTEALVTIQSSGVYKDGAPREYQKAYSSAELFAVPLAQPLRCQLTIAGVDEYYELTIHDLKIKDLAFINVAKHEQHNFGELTGDCYGYIVHRYDEEVTETFTEYFGATGQVETKESVGVYFSRQQFYNKDGSVYWGEWAVNMSATAKTTAKTSNSIKRVDDAYWKYSGWIIYLFIGLLIWPKLIAALIIVLAAFSLFPVIGNFSGKFIRFIPWLGAFIFLLVLLIGIAALLHPAPRIIKNRYTGYQPLDTHRQPIQNNKHDTLISHLVKWSDYDNHHYQVELCILQSAVNVSHAEHQAMRLNNLVAGKEGTVYAQMYHMDTGRLQYVYQAFDSITKTKHLNEIQAANMMVSCIQSIPYFLIVDQSCGADYNDEFISGYLRNCQGDCCLGNVKFGVQSPAEFIGDLKGDCDTRALVLFDILSKMGYDVALLTSALYKHALIAVHFKDSKIVTGISMPVKGNNYYLWETTSAGHPPGEIPPAISNLQYWNVSLIHQQ